MDGGGVATNAGINYQQRVSASFLTLMVLKQEISIFNERTITSLQLEGIDKIDDLIINLDDKQKLFFQIKRNVNLSDSKQSDFFKTLDQFIQQFLNNQNNESYFLVTTSYSSSKITRNLKKILDSTRLNSSNINLNVLNGADKESLNKYKKVVKNTFKKYTTRDITDKEFLEFSKRIFIMDFDIEENSSMERVVLSLMANKITINPSILWDMFISNCLRYASQRMTVSFESSQKIYNDYLSEIDVRQNDSFNILDDFLIPNFEQLNVASGKEVLLCKASDALNSISNEKNIDFYIVELFRFDEECNKKVQFIDDFCISSDKQTHLEVIYRASSHKGLLKLINENINFKNKSIGVLPANGIDYVESTLCAKAYSENLITKFKNHKDYLKCIECGKAIAENRSIIVEIEQQGSENNIGLIHKDCLKPVNRVLGYIESELFQDYSVLKNFDWKLWVEKIMHGQGLFCTKMIQQDYSVKHIIWNSSVEYDTCLNYCVKEHLEDNTFLYVLRRGQVERFSKQEADEGAIKLNEAIERQTSIGDPICITQKEQVSSTYSKLKDKLDIDDKLIKIKSYSVEKISQKIVDEYSRVSNYYAPLFYILNGENQELFYINDRVILISDPFLFESYLDNWKNSLDISLNKDYELVILKDDKHFDSFMQNIYKKEMKAVINPQFDSEENFINGYLVEEYEDFQNTLSMSTGEHGY
ncbi:MAG: hypothetical protein OIF32_01140 [Campylobacterales bacterium]|nr:hypothetical protein [Campylobacterales bacterium]